MSIIGLRTQFLLALDKIQELVCMLASMMVMLLQQDAPLLYHIEHVGFYLGPLWFGFQPAVAFVEVKKLTKGP